MRAKDMSYMITLYTLRHTAVTSSIAICMTKLVWGVLEAAWQWASTPTYSCGVTETTTLKSFIQPAPDVWFSSCGRRLTFASFGGWKSASSPKKWIKAVSIYSCRTSDGRGKLSQLFQSCSLTSIQMDKLVNGMGLSPFHRDNPQEVYYWLGW